MATTTKKINQLAPKNVLPLLNTQDVAVWAVKLDTEEVIKASDVNTARELSAMTKDANYLFFNILTNTTN